MTCKLHQITQNGIEEITCTFVKKNKESLKKTFSDINGTDGLIASGRTDRMYNDYCDQLDKFTEQCKCPVEQETRISRNIREARERRERGVSSWINCEVTDQHCTGCGSSNVIGFENKKTGEIERYNLCKNCI